MSKYDFALQLDQNNCMYYIINMIEKSGKVLEFGPANGRLTKYLKEEMKCQVTIVELDEEAGQEAMNFAEKGFIGEYAGDIEKYIWEKEIEEEYDYIIFADVLEHLHKPHKVLNRCQRFLKEDGKIIVSLPNIAHNSVLIDLLNNEFKYNQIGLLDNTHITFFTNRSFKRLLENQGLTITQVHKTYSVVGTNEICNNYDQLPTYIATYLKHRDNGEVYQYIYELKKAHISKAHVEEKQEVYKHTLACYIKEDSHEFSEDKVIKVKYTLDEKKIDVDLTNYKKIQRIRIDPAEEPCIVRNINIKSKYRGEIIPVSRTNGLQIDRDTYLFCTEDPQIYLEVNNKSLEGLEIQFQMEEMDMDNMNFYLQKLLDYNQIEVLKARNKHLEHAIELKENHIQDIEHMIQLKENHIQNIEHAIDLKENHIQNIEHAIELKENHIQSIEHAIELKENHIQNIEHIIKLKESHIQNIETKNQQLLESKNAIETELGVLYGSYLGRLAKKWIALKNKLQTLKK